MLSEELTPLPWTFNDVRNRMFDQGWSYNRQEARFEFHHEGQQWVARLRETENGVNIDTHILVNGKEFLV